MEASAAAMWNMEAAAMKMSPTITKAFAILIICFSLLTLSVDLDVESHVLNKSVSEGIFNFNPLNPFIIVNNCS